MKDTLLASFRTVLVSLAGLGGYLASHGMAAAADVPALDAAGASMQDALAAIGTALVMRLMIFLISKLTGKPEVGVSPLALIGVLVTAVAAGGLLPSCGVTYSGSGKPTFSLDPVALARLIEDWQRANDAKDSRVVIVRAPAGDTIVATAPNGKVTTEVLNPAGVIVKP